ncbi:hypothetical protein CEN41_01925 [Fischerella thermalis CCMEE 5330]|uniref:Uncharacterized protein n=1 Tax=Fischerella thermalis CCMEE 5330 TaxID=2019670 RepID=A0A2N6MNF5_9CYAN|nr:hypothetical protein CEN41_01925 [Fischerella thermalis CCMEE 5330]
MIALPLFIQFLLVLAAGYLIYRYRQIEKRLRGVIPSPAPELVADITQDYELPSMQALALQTLQTRLEAEGFRPAFLITFANSVVPHHLILLSDDRYVWAEAVADGEKVVPVVVFYTIMEDGYCIITTSPYGRPVDAPLLLARNAYDVTAAVQHQRLQVMQMSQQHGAPQTIETFADFVRLYDVFRTWHVVNLHRATAQMMRWHQIRVGIALMSVCILAVFTVVSQLVGITSAESYGTITALIGMLILALVYNVNNRLDRHAMIATAVDADVNKPPSLWATATASKKKERRA